MWKLMIAILASVLLPNYLQCLGINATNILQIEMREVFAKRGKWRVDFDKYTNLIDGPTDDINVSIPSGKLYANM